MRAFLHVDPMPPVAWSVALALGKRRRRLTPS
jgi:hypothetical protein